MKITVLMGGDSPEREISLKTGQAVALGLAKAGHEVSLVDIESVAQVMTLPELKEADVVFPALHGGQGEGGHLQAILESMDIPFALSGMAASALAMEKSATKGIMRAAGISTPDWLHICWDRQNGLPDLVQGKKVTERNSSQLTLERVFERANQELGFPLVIKLNGAGSSVGVAIVEQPDEFQEAFKQVVDSAQGSQIEVIIEKFIPGREVTATILLGRRLPLLEIVPQDGFYDYENKYTAGASDYLVPAPINSPVYEDMSADALRLFELVGCQGVARVDFRLHGDKFYCLEINTIPGMTELSLVPMSAEAVGIGFSALTDDLCQSAFRLANQEKLFKRKS